MSDEINNRELESFDDELGDLNLDDELKELEEAEGPVESTPGIKEGVADAVEPTRVVTTGLDKLVRRLPGEAGSAISDIKYGMFDVQTKVTSSLDRLRKTSRGFLSTLKDILPEPIAGHIEKLRSYLGGDEGIEEQQVSEDEKIKQEVESLFSSVTGVIKADIAERLATVTDQNELLKNIAVSTESIYGYLTSFSSTIGKRSLELQIKSVLTQVKHYEAFKKYAETTVKQLEAIVKNTGLSDFEKESLSDYVKKRLTGSAFSVGGNLFLRHSKISKIMENIGNFIEEKINAITSKLEMGESTLGFIASGKEFGLTPLYLVSNMMAEAVADKVIDKTTAKIYENVIANDPKLMEEAVKLADSPEIMVRKVREKLEKDLDKYKKELEAKKEQAEEEGKKPEKAISLKEKLKLAGMEAKLKAIKTLESITQTSDITETYNLSGYGNLFERGIFDNKFKKAVEITIPGLLAKILQEVRAIRKGRKEVSESDYEYYDYGKDRWVSKTEIKKELKKSISSNISRIYKEVYDSKLVKDFVEKFRPTKRERYELVKGIIEYLMDGKTTNVWFLKDDGILDYLKDPNLKEAFDVYLSSFEGSVNEDDIKEKVELTEELKRIKYDISNFSDVSKTIMESNLFDVAKELGITDESSPTMTSMSNIRKLYLRENKKRDVRIKDVDKELVKDVEKEQITTESKYISRPVTYSTSSSLIPVSKVNELNKLPSEIKSSSKLLPTVSEDVIDAEVIPVIIPEERQLPTKRLEIKTSSINQLENSIEFINNRELITGKVLSNENRKLYHNLINKLEMAVITTITTTLDDVINKDIAINDRVKEMLENRLEEFYTELLRVFIKRIEEQDIIDVDFIVDELESFTTDIIDITYYKIDDALVKIIDKEIDTTKIEEAINNIMYIVINKLEDAFSEVNIESEVKTVMIKKKIDSEKVVKNLRAYIENLENDDIFNNLTNKVKDIAKFVKEKVSKVIASLKDLFSSIFNSIGDVFKTRMKDIKSIKNKINEFMTNVYNNITSFVGNIFNKIRGTVKEFRDNKDASLFKKIKDLVKNTFDNVFTFFKDKFEEFTKYISDLDLKAKFTDMFKASKAKLFDIVSSVTDTIKDFGIDVSKIGNKLKDMYETTMKKFDIAITTVKNKLSEMVDIDKLKDKIDSGYDKSIEYIRKNISPKLADVIENMTDKTTGAIKKIPKTKEELLTSIEVTLKALPNLPKEVKEKLIKTYNFIKEEATDKYLELVSKIEEVNPKLADFLLNKPIEVAETISSGVDKLKEFGNNLTNGKIKDSIDMLKTGINYSVNEIKTGVTTIANTAVDAIPKLTTNLTRIREIIDKRGVDKLLESALSKYPLPTSMEKAEQLYKEIITTIEPTGELWEELSNTPRIIEDLYKIHAEVIEKKQRGLLGGVSDLIDNGVDKSVGVIGKLRDMIINALPEPLKGVAARLLDNSVTRFLGNTVKRIKDAGLAAIKTVGNELKVIGKEGVRLFIGKDGKLTLPNLYKLGKFGVRAYFGSMKAVSKGVKEFYPAVFGETLEATKLTTKALWRFSGIPGFTKRAKGRLKALIKPPIDRKLYNAWRKGDLTAKEVLNLLPDEEKEIWLEWLRENTPPGITLPSLMLTTGRGMFELMFGTSKVVKKTYPLAGKAGMKAAEFGLKTLWKFSGVKEAWRDVKDITKAAGKKVFDTLLSFIPDDLIDIVAGDMELAINDIKPRNEALKMLQDDISKLPEEVADRAKTLINEIVGIYESYKINGDTKTRERGLSKIYELINLLNEYTKPIKNKFLEKLYKFAYDKEDESDKEDKATDKEDKSKESVSKGKEPTTDTVSPKTKEDIIKSVSDDIKSKINEIKDGVKKDTTDNEDNKTVNKSYSANEIAGLVNEFTNEIKEVKDTVKKESIVEKDIKEKITKDRREEIIKCDVLKSSADKLVTELSDIKYNIKTKLTTLINVNKTIPTSIKSTITGLKEAISSKFDKLTGFISRMKDSLTKTTDAVKETIATVSDKIKSAAKKINPFDRDGDGDRDGNWKDRLEKLYGKKDKEDTRKETKQDKKEEEGLFSKILKYLPLLLMAIKGVGKLIFKSIFKVGSMLLSGLGNLLKFIPDKILKGIKWLGSLISGGIGNVIDWVKDKGGAVISKAKDLAIAAGSKIKSVATTAASKVSNIFSKSKEAITKSNIVGKAGEAVNKITSGSKAGTAVKVATSSVISSEAVNKVTNNIKEVGKATEEAAKKVINKAPKSVKSLVTKIKEALPVLKKTISKKLGPKALAKVSGTIASRFVPVLGTALLVKDAIEIGKYLLEGKGLLPALSLTYLGTDLFKNDENKDNKDTKDKDTDKDAKNDKIENIKEKIDKIEKTNEISKIDRKESVKVVEAIKESKIERYHTKVDKTSVITPTVKEHTSNVNVKPDEKSYKTLEEQKALLQKNTAYTAGIYRTLNKIAKLQEAMLYNLLNNKVSATSPFNNVNNRSSTYTTTSSKNTIDTSMGAKEVATPKPKIKQPSKPKVEPVPEPSLSTSIVDF